VARTPPPDDVDRHLPLNPLIFQILLALADGERYGSILGMTTLKTSTARWV
jgi:hypothetical protein